MEKMLPVKDAAFQLARAPQTIRSWLKQDQGAEIISAKKDGKIVIDLPSLERYAKKRSQYFMGRKARRYANLEELEKTTCPKCGGRNWRRESNYNYLKNGEVSVAMYCRDNTCSQRWSARLPSTDRLGRQRRNVFTKSGPDSVERVEADRQMFVNWMVNDGKSLSTVISAFAPSLKAEISRYYLKALSERGVKNEI